MRNDNIFNLFPPDPDAIADRDVIALARIEARDFAADDDLTLEIRAAATQGAGPVVEIGRYEIPIDRVPELVRAIGRMAALFGPAEGVSA